MKEIKLTKGQVAIVDDEDYERLDAYKWHSRFNKDTKSYYAIRWSPRDENGRYHTIWMHREIVNAPKGSPVDHINHDTLDQRKCNLRICTVSQNNSNRQMQTNNTSGYKGVDWSKSHKKWRARVGIGRASRCVGYFSTATEAAIAYDAAAVEYHGVHALTNKAMGLLPE